MRSWLDERRLPTDLTGCVSIHSLSVVFSAKNIRFMTSVRPWMLPLVTYGLLLTGLVPLTGCEESNSTSSAEPARTLLEDLSRRPADSTVETDVPYVATSQEVVNRMLELADVFVGDVVYDLGSGDGRIVITAAQRYRARGVGIEIDPVRVWEARKNAEEAGVSDRVEFRQEDLFEADFSEATVVTIYLLPEVNMKLRPKLFEQLDPGTRVISHNFDLGKWEPDSTETVGASTLYLWTIPEEIPPELKQE